MSDFKFKVCHDVKYKIPFIIRLYVKGSCIDKEDGDILFKGYTYLYRMKDTLMNIFKKRSNRSLDKDLNMFTCFCAVKAIIDHYYRVGYTNVVSDTLKDSYEMAVIRNKGHYEPIIMYKAIIIKNYCNDSLADIALELSKSYNIDITDIEVRHMDTYYTKMLDDTLSKLHTDKDNRNIFKCQIIPVLDNYFEVLTNEECIEKDFDEQISFLCNVL